ncbi:MAG: glycosyltransferase family 9 protein [Desulfovibrionaceae bacterium]|nr:glycosyltransferase family 9 protein [Desulfovibrionaceae bacterium]
MIQGLVPEDIQRILLCQQRQIGDVVLATPSIELVAKAFPWATIDFFTEKKCVPILEHNPHINHIWAVDTKTYPTTFSMLKWYWEVAHSGYDMIIALQNLPRIHWVSLFSPAKYKLSNKPPWYSRIFFTQVIPMQGEYAGEHKASVLRLLDIEWNKTQPKIYLTEEEKDTARELLYSLGVKKGTILFTIDITHRRATRKYPLEGYVQLIDAVCKRYPHVVFLPLYGPGEEDEIFRLITKVRERSSIVLPATMLSLREMASVMYYATLHIGNCSAPRHIAVAVGTPTFTILGSTDPSWTFPSSAHVYFSAQLPCQPCRQNVCPLEKDKNACLESVPIAWVLESLYNHIDTILGVKK